MKRFRAKGFGRAEPIQKKTSHVTIVLDERVPGLKRSKTKEQDAKHKEELSTEAHHAEEKKHEIKREIGSKKGVFNMGRKLFQRKSV
ncbi:MAG: hypothetical protein UW79_C0021G0018 [Candidatus Yanofskybacteria bacterium GW2011_GWA2_44_9]|uniref:50S ribosomal protein L22 n=1 Tax=Candidatus Yanofskybacteria bacterium GW2011_GWA2_44_9 TaxID=1619025 RepID=A0A0G1KCP2_9BACT|nr:MAG: hypothetical protein UW79_C0021G0018 [Candidatus Yanofskybacteria bacterium GW2011_GWA2_44_9]